MGFPGPPYPTEHDCQLARHRMRKALSSPDYRVRCVAKFDYDLPMTRSERRQARKVLKPSGQPWKLHGYQVRQWEPRTDAHGKEVGGRRRIRPTPDRADPRQTMMREDTLERAARAIGL